MRRAAVAKQGAARQCSASQAGVDRLTPRQHPLMMFQIARRSEGNLMADCTKCGVQLKDGSRFCAHCGAAVSCCPKCGQTLKDGARFCAGCGAPVSESSSQADVSA